ncbi:serine hydrolase [Nonlabens sp. SCSIO 43208]|uniref:glycoside hydrolase family 3 N-terminal domain-containing protein n=1 Tax=Nonlabens sp. SCSIO 43208 TaxID=2793009 RepID=UPI003D6A74D8
MNLKHYNYYLVSLVFLGLAFAKAQSPTLESKSLKSEISQSVNPLHADDVIAQQIWVDSIYNQMTTRQKIGQLFMVDLFSNKEKAHIDKVRNLIKNHEIGGIIFSKGTPQLQAPLTNELQALSNVPLMIGMDAEWGLAMRLENTFAYPWNMTLGANPGDELTYEVGKRIGEHCKRLGVHINFAPDVDINTNPDNPIIGNRSFGEDRDNVTRKALAFMNGMQSVGVLASAKHFPGHGDTDQDSHKTLPTVSFDAKRINEIELYPYKRLIDNNLASVMVAHLNVPSLETRAGYPTSLSEKVVSGLLQRDLGFQGLIFTDALNMKGASNFSSPGDIDLAAFKAGNDVLLISENVPKAIDKIEEALKNGEITEDRLKQSVVKILQAKYLVGLHQYTPIELSGLQEDLITNQDVLLYEKSISNSVTLLKNTSNLLPLKNLETKKIAYVQMGDDHGDAFIEQLNKYSRVDLVRAARLDELMNKLSAYNTVIIGFHKSNDSPWKSYSISDKELTWMYEIARKHDVILDAFVNPYTFRKLKSTTNFESIIASYQNSEVSQQVSAQMIFGARDFKGKLPVTSGEFKVGTGIYLPSIGRLSYSTIPESAGLSSAMIAKIDSIANHTIDHQGAPGMQVLVARKGRVVFDTSYGFHTYDKRRRVSRSDKYDIASVTKIVATLPLVMELQEQGILSLDDTLGELLPAYRNTDKENITIKQMLSHYARLKPWTPFYSNTLDSITQKPLKQLYSNTKKGGYSLIVANNLYGKSVLKDSISNSIRLSSLREKLEYKYSDFPYYILKDFIEGYYNQDLNELTQNHFYASLGMENTTYLPRNKFDKSEIVPTENDTVFRDQLVHGFVHDQGAAMQGGIGGHAGVFSTSNDIAKMMQMYLQGGYYGGKSYFKEETINTFNFCYYCDQEVRRGVGFDKPQLDEVGPTCGCVSMQSFGHSGFTGAYTWADPENEIVYVFLANRIHPDANNKFLIEENIRTNIQQVIYDHIIE